MGHDKRDAAAEPVIAVCKVTVQRDQVALQVSLETQLVNGIALGPAAIEIGIEHGLKRKAGLGGHQSQLQPCCNKCVRERGFNSGRPLSARTGQPSDCPYCCCSD